MQNGKDGTQMKATGIVRRIDELGRVVIPKEIRRTQRIRRGDPLEIFTTGDGEVIFKKYSPVGELQGVAVQYAEVLSRSFALTAFVADRDRILAAAGSGRRDLADRSVSQPLEKVMESRKPYLSEGDPEHVLLPCEGSLRPLLCAWPIIAAGDVHRGRRAAGRGSHPAARPRPAEGRGRGGSVSGKADGGVNIIIIGSVCGSAGVPFFVYDRIMNLYKLFREAIDREKFLAIMVLALRKMEC